MGIGQKLGTFFGHAPKITNASETLSIYHREQEEEEKGELMNRIALEAETYWLKQVY